VLLLGVLLVVDDERAVVVHAVRQVLSGLVVGLVEELLHLGRAVEVALGDGTRVLAQVPAHGGHQGFLERRAVGSRRNASGRRASTG
jgi:hypothetical protein